VLNYKNLAIKLRAYSLPVFCVSTALMVTQSLKNPVFPTPLFFASIVISTWFGGTVPGLIAVTLAALALDYYFIPPLHSLTLNKPEMPYLFEFAVPALITCWFMRKRRITESTLRQARDELETKVRERQEELARVTRAMTVGELGVSVAHEVNQPLMAVVLNGDACLRWLAANPPNLKEAREAVTRVVEQGNRAGEIVGRIRALSKKTAPQRLPVNLNEAIEESLALVERELSKNRILLKTELAQNLAFVSGDRVQLQQVILNLVMNGIEAVSANGNSPRELTVRTESPGTGDVTVTVEDSGTGLPPGDPEQMFAAFFTTKPQGLGMGLAISRTIVETHGGRLWATDSGRGAVFHFRLPSS